VTRASLLDVVEAIYRDVTADKTWLDGIARAFLPLVDDGAGVLAFPFHVGARSLVVPWIRSFGGRRAVPAALLKSVMAASSGEDETVRVFRAVPPCLTASESGLTSLPAWDRLRERGIEDCLAVHGLDTTGRGVEIGVMLPKMRRARPRERARLSRVAAHLGVGLRYRVARVRGSAPDAVLSPSAKLVHAEGYATSSAARQALVAAVKALDRARGPAGRRAPGEALEAWKGLVLARWSLVDSFESDGRRFVVAKQNEPVAPVVENLTKRERQVAVYAAAGHSSKLIAYELGIADSTVRVLLGRAMKRLQVGDRAALAEALSRAASASAGES
jgi:DNA-binding CsgD family transcriptional regulator